jgi:ferredoxin
MVKRQIIKIDEDTCTGCGDCIPNCPEGALQIIDDKARIISDLFCDGLGACIGHCPVDAISIEEREAEEYSERKVMENVVKQGPNVIEAHLSHLHDHGQTEYFNQAVEYLKENNFAVPNISGAAKEDPAPASDPVPAKGPVHACPGSAVMDLRNESQGDTLACGCPSSTVMDLKTEEELCEEEVAQVAPMGVSELRQWPVQIMLVPPSAPYLQNAELLIAADCVPFAYPDFHRKFLKGKILLVGCPKLDDAEFYVKKLQQMFEMNDIKSITIAHMEVPCCFGLIKIINQAVGQSGKNIPIKGFTIGVKGDVTED